MALNFTAANFFQEVFFYSKQSQPDFRLWVRKGLRLSSHVDRDRLQRTVGRLFQNHDSLRTVLRWDSGSKTVVQRVFGTKEILPDSSYVQKSFPNLTAFLDFAGEGPSNEVSLETTLPLRIVTASIAEDEQLILIVDMLSTVYDNVSWEALKYHISVLYRSHAEDDASTSKPAFVASFVSFASTQRRLVENFYGQEAQSYFTDLLQDYNRFEIPHDVLNVPDSSTTQGNESQTFALNADEIAKIDSHARVLSISSSSIFTAAFVLTLSTFANQSEVVLGHHFANRPSSDLERAIGRYKNFLPVRVNVNATQSIGLWLQYIYREVKTTEKYQAYPFESLARDVGIDYAAQIHPIFSHVFKYQIINESSTRPIGGEAVPTELAIEDFPLPSCEQYVNPFELVLQVERQEACATVAFSAPSAKLSQHFIAGLAETYKLILSQLSAFADIRSVCLNDMCWTQRSILHQPQSLTLPKPVVNKSLAALFEKHASLSPGSLALVCGNAKLTFNELHTRSSQLANYFSKVGVRRGSYFGIIMDPCIDMMVAVLASWKLGAPYIGIYPSETPPERLAGIAEDAEMRFAVTVESYAPYVQAQPDIHTIAIDRTSIRSEIDRMSPFHDSTDINGDDIAYCSFTSGTTGKPKGVITPHRGVVLFAEDFSSVYFDHPYETGVEQSVLMLSRLVTDFSVEQIALGFCSGNKLVLVPSDIKTNMDEMYRYLNDNRVTYISGPSLAIGRFDLARLPHSRIMVTCGEKFQRSLLNMMRRTFRGSIYNGYGITETAIYTTIRRYVMSDTWSPSVGWPGVGQRFYITDHNLRPLPYGAIGELYISGIGVARGYLNRPEKTRESFLPNPFVDPAKEPDHATMYKTGDYMRFMDDGSLEFKGRIDNKVLVRGVRIEPDEVKAALALFPNIKECEVLSKSQLGIVPGRSDGLVAYYSSLTGRPFSSESIVEFLGKRVPHDVLPDEFLYVEGDFPSTASGKLELRRLPKAQGGSSSPAVPPSNAIETHLCKIWSEILERPVGTLDDFFDSGGNSILALRAAHEMTAQTEILISSNDLLQCRNIARITRQMAKSPEAEAREDDGIQELTTSKDFALSAPQRRFFETNLRSKDHYNQCIVIHTPALDIDKLQKAYDAIQHHQDCLRLSFPTGEHERLQRVLPKHRNDGLTVLQSYNTIQLQSNLDQLHASLSLEIGKVAALAYIHTADESAGVIWLALHDLITDCASWQLIANDLQASYEGLSLSKGTSSYSEWLAFVQAHQPDGAEKSHWSQIQTDVGIQMGILPPALEQVTSITTLIPDFGHSSFEQNAGRIQQSATNELIALAALSHALWHWNPEIRFITVESSARAIESGGDFSRSIGPLTAKYPLRLEYNSKVELHIQKVVDILARVPNQGLTYQSLHGHQGMPPISFRYLGDFQTPQAGQRTIWTVVPGVQQDWGKPADDEDQFTLTGLLDVTAWTVDRALKIGVRGRADAAIVEAIATRMSAFLREGFGEDLASTTIP